LRLARPDFAERGREAVHDATKRRGSRQLAPSRIAAAPACDGSPGYGQHRRRPHRCPKASGAHQKATVRTVVKSALRSPWQL
jgi:hypothetical protein